MWVTRLWVYLHSSADPLTTLHIMSFTHAYSRSALYIGHYFIPRMSGEIYIYIYIYIVTTLYMYYPVYEVMMGARCAMVMWHIWRHYIWYIYYIYVICFLLTVCHAPCCPPITTPIFLLLLVLSWCISKVKLTQSHLALNYCSLAHNYSRCVVDRRWLRRRCRYLTACGDCCLQLPLPGDLC